MKIWRWISPEMAMEARDGGADGFYVLTGIIPGVGANRKNVAS